MDPGVFALLRCAACGGGIAAAGRDGVCQRCHQRVSARRGYLDLIDGRAGEPTPSSPEQRLMESELVARVYERVFRPAFVRVLAGSGAGGKAGGVAGEIFIHKSCLALDEREGPWLDLSCGAGVFSRAMAAAAPGDLVVGADISKAMLEVAATAAKGYANLALVRADAHDLPFADESFAGVNNAGSLHVYDDPEAVFGEIWRVLRPGGVYVGSTFSRASSLFGRTASKLAGIRRFDPPELRAWLSRLGFSDYEDIRLAGAFIFRARRP